MKILLPILFVVIAALATPSLATAYGGGGGFPPGYADNPHLVAKLVCERAKQPLPFGREIFVPRCKIAQVQKAKTDTKNLPDRLNELVARVITGGK